MSDDLKTRLKIAKSKFKKNNPSAKDNEKSSFGKAFQLSTELVSAVLVATIIGFILDNWFDTKPWLIILFFFIGVAAGIINVVRSAKKMQKD
jgi:ATP synthase protein I|tara:strand:+ start:1037 stop:1312 length:276 start_codon:yes stop_codon:yes gene_type:complete